MTPDQEGHPDPRPNPPSPWRLLVVPALAALFAFGVALALPTAPSAPLASTSSQACGAGEVNLPPGHPPIGGFMRLPPGHPPIDGPGAQRAAPPRSAPTFQAPEILDI